jgi:uncharacterized membrane protein
MADTIIIVTWENMDRAKQALDSAKKLDKEKLIELKDAVVVVKDEQGDIKVKEAVDATAKGGAISGGLIGLTIGAVLGGPIGGLVLGAAAGAFAGKKIDLGIPREKIDAVGESMVDGSSAIFLQIGSGKKDFLQAAVRQSGGHVVEFSVADEVAQNVEDSLSAYTGHIGE